MPDRSSLLKLIRDIGSALGKPCEPMVLVGLVRLIENEGFDVFKEAVAAASQDYYESCESALERRPEIAALRELYLKSQPADPGWWEQ